MLFETNVAYAYRPFSAVHCIQVESELEKNEEFINYFAELTEEFYSYIAENALLIKEHITYVTPHSLVPISFSEAELYYAKPKKLCHE